MVAAAALAAAAGAPPTAADGQRHDLLATLNSRQLAGERVIYSYPGRNPPQSLLAQIAAGDAAGVILFKDNIVSASQIAQVTSELQTAAARSPVKTPLLIMTDQEGGQVRRLPGQPILSEKQIGQSADPGPEAALAGRGAGAALKSVGVNVNLAPVLDVYRQPGDFIDRYGRSYSAHPAAVARLGADFIRAQQQAGVAATAKHFPGLGAAARGQNTDRAPVRLNVSLSRLRSWDEAPYRSAIAARVKLVMVSWAVYPAIDPRRPAGLSADVVRELRQHLRFRGLTITDALGAGALRHYGSTSRRAVLAAGAGMDLLLCASQQVSQGTAAVGALSRALTNGSLRAPAFTASVQRVLALRRNLSR